MTVHSTTSERRWLRIAILLWVAILAAIAGRLLAKPQSNSVYPIFATAGAHWRDGKSVYTERTPELDHFRYGPAVAAWFSGWSILPRPIGEVAWRALNAIVFLGALVAWSRWRLGRSYDWVMLLLVIPLAVGGINNGQCNALIAGLLLLAQVWFDREHWWAAAGAIAVAVLFKQYPIALGALLCLLEPRRFTPRLVACLLIGFAAPFLLRSPSYVAEQYAEWMAVVGGDDRTDYHIAIAYRDLQMLLRVWGWPMTLAQYRVLELAMALAAAVTMRSQLQFWSRHQTVWACGALAACWMTVVGPATESTTYVLAAPFLADCVIRSRLTSPALRILALASWLLFTVAAMIVWFPREVSRIVQETGIQPLAGVMLAVAVIIETRRERHSQTFDEPIQPSLRFAASASSVK